jgi:hypothetical protein
MELTLNINKSTAKKIQALSILNECDASGITNLISTHIDALITNEILRIIAEEGNFNFGPRESSSAGQIGIDEQSIVDGLKIENKDESLPENDKFLEEVWPEDITEEDDGPMIFGVADSMGQKVDDVIDEELPEKIQEELEDMTVKTKDGEETGYDDEIMADAQAMAEGEFYGQDDVIAAAAGSLEGSLKNLSRTGDDSPREEGGIPSNTPDILPVDLGIDSASSDDGGMAFFGQVIKGTQGDKSARNRVTRKRKQK